MFKQENRYVSRQVNETVPMQLQILLWSMIDSLKEKKELDYLQIFRLKVKEDSVVIEHEQEVPKYKKRYEVDKKLFPIERDIKVYVIDDVDYSTMIFAEEY
jgi:NAD-dependent DNA ligase